MIFSETADGLESAPLSAQPSSALANPEVKGDAYYEDNRIWPSQPQHTRQELAETFQHLLDLVYSQDSSSEMTDESGRLAALQSKVALLEHELAAARKDLATAGQDLAKANAVTLARQRSFETLKTQNLELTQRLALYEQRKSQKKVCSGNSADSEVLNLQFRKCSMRNTRLSIFFGTLRMSPFRRTRALPSQPPDS